MKSALLQQAVYTALNVSSMTTLLSDAYTPLPSIFSDVPQAADSATDLNFPFLVIGGDTLTPWDTKDKLGESAVVQVDVFYRGTSKLAAKAISDEVDTLMRRTSLTITGATHITTELMSLTPSADPDGRTLRLVMLYRVTYIST